MFVSELSELSERLHAHPHCLLAWPILPISTHQPTPAQHSPKVDYPTRTMLQSSVAFCRRWMTTQVRRERRLKARTGEIPVHSRMGFTLNRLLERNEPVDPSRGAHLLSRLAVRDRHADIVRHWESWGASRWQRRWENYGESQRKQVVRMAGLAVTALRLEGRNELALQTLAFFEDVGYGDVVLDNERVLMGVGSDVARDGRRVLPSGFEKLLKEAAAEEAVALWEKRRKMLKWPVTMESYAVAAEAMRATGREEEAVLLENKATETRQRDMERQQSIDAARQRKREENRIHNKRKRMLQRALEVLAEVKQKEQMNSGQEA